MRHIILIAIFVLSAIPAEGQSPSRSEITGSPCLNSASKKADKIEGMLESIRDKMSKTLPKPVPIRVSNATKRDIFFQVRLLEEKAEWLSFETTHAPLCPKEDPLGKISWSQVELELDATIRKLVKVQTHLKISARDYVARSAVSSLEDLYHSVHKSGRQLNVLLIRKVQPQDVFKMVTHALSYSSRLRALFPRATMPRRPKYRIGLKPIDVFEKLLSCHQVLRSMAKKSGIRIIQFSLVDEDWKTAEPSDVLDIAALIVAQLHHFHSQSKAKPALALYDPRYKTPSDVFQRATILERLLNDLNSMVDKKTSWLDKR